jgi:hypothetical protein
MSNIIKTANDNQKNIFVDLLSIEFVPTDHHAGGDINGHRIMSMISELDTGSLRDTEDGSGEYILGVLHARGLMDFHWRPVNDFAKAVMWLQIANRRIL